MSDLIPIVGILSIAAIPISVFIWKYLEGKGKRETILEISKVIDDPSQVDELIRVLDVRKKEPIDYRRSGVITLFIGIGLFLFGFVAVGDMLVGVGLLIGTIGAGTIIAGYLFPHTSSELTDAVEKFEKK